jgi:hypothetical protein
MGVAYLTHWREENCTQNFIIKNLKEREYLIDIGTDERIILQRILTK